MVTKLSISLLLVGLVATAKKCLPGTFECFDSSCIPERYVCDEYIDCAGGEDEMDCAECMDGYFHCIDDVCIVEHYVCDGYYDCFHGEDERDCSTSAPGCEEGYFECPSGLCILPKYLCDGWADCYEDGSDEIGCEECNGAFHCEENKCIRVSKVCNGVENCINGEDEIDCGESKAPVADPKPRPPTHAQTNFLKKLRRGGRAR